jgi:hypothetical protein
MIILWLQVNFLMGSICFGQLGFELGLLQRTEAGPDHRCSALVASTDIRRRVKSNAVTAPKRAYGK